MHSKTICDSFDEQLEIAEKLYGRQMNFVFSTSDIREALNAVSIYDAEVKERAEKILSEQRKKYKYLFKP